MIEVCEKIDLRQKLNEARKSGKTTGLVPTMGYLHEGHLSLVKRSVSECDFTVVSIYVNPTQFGPSEDLDKYPRDLKRDEELLEKENVDLVYYPTDDSMYSKNHSTWIIEDSISKILCGSSRPIHFKGVLTVVAKLFNLVQPDFAYFGQKDYQQAVLINKMVKELDFPVKVEICPIVRERDGIAMSSRNKYLDSKQHESALVLNKTLQNTLVKASNGVSDVNTLVNEGKEYFRKNANGVELEYLEILDAENLEDISSIENRKAVILIAGRVGATRLIDNMLLGTKEN